MMSWIRVTVFEVLVMFLATGVTDSTDADGVMMQNSLIISIYDVSLDFVEIDWNYKDSKHSQIISCELIYGPVSDLGQVQVYTGIIIVPDEHMFKLNGLENNVTYQLRMTCHNDKGHNFHSNALRFTTGSKPFPMNYVFRGHSSLARDSFYSRDDDHARTVRSSNVILGAICGIVGFLIINVTIVMVVRKYSHRQMHRRRIMEIEERDYDDFPYLRGYE